MLFCFLHHPKSQVILEQLRSSLVVVENLTYGLIRFYCGIADADHATFSLLNNYDYKCPFRIKYDSYG